MCSSDLKSDEDLSGFEEVVLVAWNEEGNSRVCVFLSSGILQPLFV